MNFNFLHGKTKEGAKIAALLFVIRLDSISRFQVIALFVVCYRI